MAVLGLKTTSLEPNTTGPAVAVDLGIPQLEVTEVVEVVVAGQSTPQLVGTDLILDSLEVGDLSTHKPTDQEVMEEPTLVVVEAVGPTTRPTTKVETVVPELLLFATQ